MGTRLRVAVVGGGRSRRESLADRVQASGRCQVVASTPAGRTAVARVQEMQPDLVLVWLDSPMVEVMELVQRIVDACPYAAVWLVGNGPSEAYAPLARRWGAEKYVTWREMEAQVQNLAGEA